MDITVSGIQLGEEERKLLLDLVKHYSGKEVSGFRTISYRKIFPARELSLFVTTIQKLSKNMTEDDIPICRNLLLLIGQIDKYAFVYSDKVSREEKIIDLKRSLSCILEWFSYPELRTEITNRHYDYKFPGAAGRLMPVN